MNYSEPLISQVTVFFRSVGCGVLLGVLYAVFSAVRMILGERKRTYIFFDTAYFVFAALISFFFMVLYNSGQVRLNIMLAELLGGVGFHFAFGKYLLARYATGLGFIRKICCFFMRPFVRLTNFVLGFFDKMRNHILKESEKKFKKKVKKICNISKILLKNQNKSV